MRHSTSRTSADRHANGLGRSVVEQVDDTKLMQNSKHSLFADEQQDQIEHAHPYGFVNVPKKPTGQGTVRRAAEAFLSYLGGNRSHGIALIVGDRRYRLYQLDEGEVALHDDQGQQVHLKRDGIWASVPQSKSIKLQIMDDDQMPQDPKAQGGGTNQAQKMGQIKQAGRAAAINIVLDKTQFTVNHPNGNVNINCKNFTVTASNIAKLKGTAGTLLKGLANCIVGTNNFFKASSANNAKAAGNQADPDWATGAGDPPITD